MVEWAGRKLSWKLADEHIADFGAQAIIDQFIFWFKDGIVHKDYNQWWQQPSNLPSNQAKLNHPFWSDDMDDLEENLFTRGVKREVSRCREVHRETFEHGVHRHHEGYAVDTAWKRLNYTRDVMALRKYLLHWE